MMAQTIDPRLSQLTASVSKPKGNMPVWLAAPPRLQSLDFTLPSELEANEPPEARGLGRDEVRLMVSYLHNDQVDHTQFRALPEFLSAGDLIVINTSGTLNAAVPATRADGTAFELHLSTQLPGNLWLVELRRPENGTTRPFFAAKMGERLSLPGKATVTLYGPYRAGESAIARGVNVNSSHNDKQAKHLNDARLWVAALDLPVSVQDYLDEFGSPIRYNYVADVWPKSYYQTVYATEAGSAEMPSAGRAFTEALITRLVAKGVLVAPLLLHTGVASLEAHEPPYEEYYRVPAETAHLINLTRRLGKRVVAVGTTVVRALETVSDAQGTVHPGEGWTDLVITPERGFHAVDAMLTGFHEPQASHLAMMEALAGRSHLKVAYAEALREHYLWHEFGDLHLILP